MVRLCIWRDKKEVFILRREIAEKMASEIKKAFSQIRVEIQP